MPAREGFALGRLMVAPSRTESLPYIILETAAAAVPLITTNVGGIPEVFGRRPRALFHRAMRPALASAIQGQRSPIRAALRNETLTLQARVQSRSFPPT